MTSRLLFIIKILDREKGSSAYPNPRAEPTGGPSIGPQDARSSRGVSSPCPQPFARWPVGGFHSSSERLRAERAPGSEPTGVLISARALVSVQALTESNREKFYRDGGVLGRSRVPIIRVLGPGTA